MSNLTRGTKNEDEGKDADQGSRDPLDIPRFLNRQNNQ
jgi:cell division protein FtsZ